MHEKDKGFPIHDCAATGEALTGRVPGDRLGLDCGSEAQSSISLASERFEGLYRRTKAREARIRRLLR